MVENGRSCRQVSGRLTVAPDCFRTSMNRLKSSSVSSMTRWGKGPRGMLANGRCENSATWVLRSGEGNRAFSGLPTMTSSSGSHSVQLQTFDIVYGTSFPPRWHSQLCVGEEVLYGDEVAGGPSAVIDPLADSQIENAEAERREHDGPSAINPTSPSDDLSE